MKIEKQNYGNIIINEATRKLAEIKKDKIYRFKKAVQYGMNFRVKDIREKQNQNNSDFNHFIVATGYREYVSFSLPVITSKTTGGSNKTI
ncbi:hypothetical protein [Borreliella garinii]|uniref:hypothetical protein n=2 Tax=Borreliella garinii TaxID=29519 RepID=UPI00040FCD99|nr:hypothetical protein [Borreliella garinii]